MNVVAFPIRDRQSRPSQAFAEGATVVAFPVRQAAEQELPRDIELGALERALASLASARASGNLADVREWLDELEVMEMHTERFDIRGRCRSALLRAQDPLRRRCLLGTPHQNQQFSGSK